MIALDLDDAVFQRTASATAFFQRRGQLFKRVFSQRHTGYRRNRLATTAFAFATYASNAITGVPLAAEPLKELATVLKKRCGTGGALKDGIIEIQGDHVELLLAELIKLGYKAKKSGG